MTGNMCQCQCCIKFTLSTNAKRKKHKNRKLIERLRMFFCDEAKAYANMSRMRNAKCTKLSLIEWIASVTQNISIGDNFLANTDTKQ